MKPHKSTFPLILLIAILILGAILIGGTVPPGNTALAQSSTGRAVRPLCTQKSIQGSYGFISSGSAGPPTIPAEVSGPLVGVGTVNFGSRGGFTLIATRSVNGSIDPQPLTLTGSYVVNPDCTLTMSFAVGFTFRAVIVDGGKEIQFIETDPGTTFIVVAKRM